MRIDTQRTTCSRCGHVFDGEVVLDAPIAVYVASLSEMICPKCGADFKSLAFGGEHAGAPSLDTPVEFRANWWKTRGEVGTSSETIYCAFMGLQTSGRCGYDVPHDPDDFRRCVRLFEIVPEWRSDLGKVTERFPWWAPFEKSWDELEKLYKQEFPKGHAPLLYAAMQVLVKKSREIRNRGGA